MYKVAWLLVMQIWLHQNKLLPTSCLWSVLVWLLPDAINRCNLSCTFLRVGPVVLLMNTHLSSIIQGVQSCKVRKHCSCSYAKCWQHVFLAMSQHTVPHGSFTCRRRHADVVEWIWFINSYGDNGVYEQLMNGDKDSFLLAFALANKSSEYYQVCAKHEAVVSQHLLPPLHVNVQSK